MTLRFYNTLTKQKQEFTPLNPQSVRMYVCGPTVYDFAHIGNARPVIVFDMVYRLLRHVYGESHVTYVRNITDVDDKINARALRDFPNLPLNEAIRRVTETTANQYQKDVAELGCLLPTEQPRATDNIAEMIAMIETLIAKNHAYIAAGEVLFDTTSMPDYGQLSGRKLEEQKAGARIAVEAHKKNPADFVLWKLSSPEEPGWESPWGRGRPGWHIECSAMSKRYLGEEFDIHGGGLDLIFPHHENEIAQSRCCNGTHKMASIWMHNGFLQVEGQKMSKSLGNFRTIREVLNDWPGDVARFNMLRTHYRQPIDWKTDQLTESKTILQNWRGLIQAALQDFSDAAWASYMNFELPAEVLAALGDDLNVNEAVTFMHQLAKDKSRAAIEKLFAALHFFALIKQEDFAAKTSEADAAKIEQLLEARRAAKLAKNWAESDRIRDALSAMNIVIKDNKDGTTSWEVKPQ